MHESINSNPSRADPPGPLWRNRDFVIIRAGQAVSTLGSQMSRVVLPLLTLELTGSPALTGLVSLASGIPMVLFGLPLGVAVDRCDRRLVMTMSAASMAIGTASIAVALYAHRLSLVHLVAVGFVTAICGTAYGTAESAAIPQVVSPDHIRVAMAQNEAATRTSQLIGPPIGGALFGIARSLPFVADSISSAILVAALLTIRSNLSPEQVPGTRRLSSDIGDGLAWVFHQPMIRTTLLLTAGSNFLLTGIYLLVIVVARNAGASPAAIGLIFTLEATFAIAGTLLAPTLARRLSLAQTVIGSHWLWVLLSPLYLVSSHIVALGIITGLVFGVSPIGNVILISYQVRSIPTHLRDRVGSVAGLITAGPMPCGTALCGLLIQLVGPASTVAIFTGGAFLLALAATLSPSVRDGGHDH